MKQPQMNEPLYPLLGVNRLRMEIDGEGVTTLAAGAGCPLACRYCINAEALRKQPAMVTAEELYDRVRIDDLYFRATGGGVTFGGGESLLHTAFFREFRALASGWRLYAETSLAVPQEAVREAAGVIDGFIVDMKCTDPAVYAAYTGRDVQPLVLSNLQLLLTLRSPEDILVRIPRIPGFTSDEDCGRSEALLRSLGVTRIDRFDYIVETAP